MMEMPKYRLDFEMDTYYDIREEIEVELSKNSKVTLHPSKTTNKGSVIFEKDTLDQSHAESEGKTIANHFIDLLIISLDPDNMVPLRFGKLELLNPEDFKEKTKTVYKDLSISFTVVGSIDRRKVEATKDIVKKMSRLGQEEQKSLCRSVFWLRRAAEAAGEERFVYRWISLEALCGVLPEMSSTQKMINNLLHKYLKIESARSICDRNKNIIDELGEANLVGWKGSKRSDELKEMIEDKADCKAILSKAALCAFEVRNSLFHKGEALSLLGGCNILLRDIINKTTIDILGN